MDRQVVMVVMVVVVVGDGDKCFKTSTGQILLTLATYTFDVLHTRCAFTLSLVYRVWKSAAYAGEKTFGVPTSMISKQVLRMYSVSYEYISFT